VPGIESSPEPSEALELLPVSALRDDLVLRQRVTIRWLDGEESFEAVLQKRESELLLLGLGPMNVVGFSLRVDEDAICHCRLRESSRTFSGFSIRGSIRKRNVETVSDGGHGGRCR